MRDANPIEATRTDRRPTGRARDPKVVLVTGASTGIGRRVAEALRARGHRVYGTSRSPARPGGDAADLLALDVTSDASVEGLVAELARRGVEVDVLVNNAGYDLIGAAEETTVAETDAQMQTNFVGAVRVTRALLPMLRRRRGRVVNVGSTGGFLGLPFNAAYTASKHALAGYSEALRYELAPFGVRVSLVEPAGVRTDTAATSLRTVATPMPAYAAGRAVMRAAFDASVRDGGLTMDVVGRAVVRVVERSRPPLRVLVGRQARLLRLAKVWLPAAWLERVVVDRFTDARQRAAGASTAEATA